MEQPGRRKANSARAGMVTCVCSLLVCIPVSGFGFGFWSRNNRANKLFYGGRYREAMELYELLERIAEGEGERVRATVKYNRANTLLKMEEHDRAMESYEDARSLTSDRSAEENICYNMGNTAYRSGDYEEAIGYYKKVLDIDPDDEDAKFNIELIKKKQEQQEKEQREKEERGEQENGRAEEEEQEKEGQDGGEEEERSEEEEQGQEQRDEGENEDERERKDELTKEEAMRILRALQEREKEAREEERAGVGGRYNLLKDW